MTYATERSRYGHEPAKIVRLEGDYCDLTYGVAPCTATGAAGSECYQTIQTCDDSDNYTGGGVNVKLYWFCTPNTAIPVSIASGEGAMTSVLSVKIKPGTIAIDGGLGVRGSVVVTLQDEPHHDRGVDPYVANRSYDAQTTGTFWGKWLARNPYYQGRKLVIYSGWAADPFSLTNDFVTRTYFIEKITGPNAAGIVTITGKDILKLADDDRAKCPAQSPGRLAEDVGVDATTATLSPVGIGASDYSASGTLRIGNECIQFTRSADALTFTARGSDGSTAAEHQARDQVQECKRYTAQMVDDVAYDLAINYGNVDSAYITAADWSAENDKWLLSHPVSALITEPTPVRQLLKELGRDYGVRFWWQETLSSPKIAFSCIAPLTSTPDTLTDVANVKAGSFAQTEDPSKRLSQVWVHYGIRDPTGDLDDPTNYHYTKINAALGEEAAAKNGESRIETIFSRWFSTSGDAIALGSRRLRAHVRNPRIFTFALDFSDDYWTGDVVRLELDRLQGETGASGTIDVRIISTEEDPQGHGIVCQAVWEQFEGRTGTICSDAQNDYGTATEQEKADHAFIAATSAGFSDGTAPYEIS